MDERLSLIKDLNRVKLPRWDEFPEFGIYRDQLISIVNSSIDNVLYIEENTLLTKSMLNNYVKWKMIPKPIKKKYYKNHIAFCIVISCFKPILTIANINKGIKLQTRIESEENAYNRFCNILESIFNKDISNLNDLGTSDDFKVNSNNLGIYTSCKALYYKRISDLILSSTEDFDE
ncbi:MAG: DUF1836 domain-containing protein [Andreesenia angusta]|nr:DUF1836 domain-containing protein [Andreesenia angusta]